MQLVKRPQNIKLVPVFQPQTANRQSQIDPPDAILAEAWSTLSLAVTNRKCAMHTPVVATIGLDGKPRARVVVLRRVEPTRREVYFHTDRRSPKFAELSRDARVQVVLYEPESRIQIRLDGAAQLHTDDAIADEQWERSHPNSRECYKAGVGSSEAIAEALATGNAFIDGRPNFAAVRVIVAELEWLWLHHEGHRRIAFDVVRGTHRWLAP